jgi:YD repeat-containing protein
LSFSEDTSDWQFTSGNPLTSKVEGTGLFINSSATYTDDKNYIDTITGSLGNKVDFNYNKDNGNLDSVIDANGSRTDYLYDTLGRLKEVSKTTPLDWNILLIYTNYIKTVGIYIFRIIY